jgi:hypothetical protein
MVEKASSNGASKAYLIVDDEVIYELSQNTVLNIGRLETNDIVLDDYKVSREHAVLKFSRTQMMLVDLASTHGSFINGQRIDRAVIQFGDKIQIVNHELTLLREVPEAKSGEHLVPRTTRSLDRRLKFFGGLNEFPLLTLVQFLHTEKQTGLLLLELGQAAGPRLYFQNGEIIHVTNGENLAELLTRERHEESLFFYFHHETNFPPRTIQQSTPNYLMTLCHQYDEAGKTGSLVDTASVWIPLPRAEMLRMPTTTLAR